jgi:hypothetical protein
MFSFVVVVVDDDFDVPRYLIMFEDRDGDTLKASTDGADGEDDAIIKTNPRVVELNHENRAILDAFFDV